MNDAVFRSLDIVREQMQYVVNCVSDDQYKQSIPDLKGVSIGCHMRHIYDCYFSILSSSGSIDYSRRNRNIVLEHDKEQLTMALEDVLSKLSALNPYERIEVKTDFFSDELADRDFVSSTIGRELMYAFDHAIHHLAIIKLGLNGAYPEIKLAEKVGVAPSTLRYHSSR